MTTAVPPEMSARSAQTLAMLVKVAGRVPLLGRVPSCMRQVVWEDWLQGLHALDLEVCGQFTVRDMMNGTCTFRTRTSSLLALCGHTN